MNQKSKEFDDEKESHAKELVAERLQYQTSLDLKERRLQELCSEVEGLKNELQELQRSYPEKYSLMNGDSAVTYERGDVSDRIAVSCNVTLPYPGPGHPSQDGAIVVKALSESELNVSFTLTAPLPVPSDQTNFLPPLVPTVSPSAMVNPLVLPMLMTVSNKTSSDLAKQLPDSSNHQQLSNGGSKLPMFLTGSGDTRDSSVIATRNSSRANELRSFSPASQTSDDINGTNQLVHNTMVSHSKIML